MSYGDENIIKIMNKHKTGISGSIEEGFVIKEKKVLFKEVSLFDNRMKIMLPEDFEDMPMEVAKIKYPMEQRPQVIKTNSDGDINFTFSYIEQEIKNEQIKEMTDLFKKILRKVKSDINFIEENFENIGELAIGWFDFISNGYDQKIYNLMYFMPIDGKMLHGIFNCLMQDINNWKPVVLQVMHTISENT